MQQQITYRSLAELQERKDQIQRAIRIDNKDIIKKWRSLFYEHKKSRKKGFSMVSLINTGAGLLDGFMLAWKLYNKFRR